MYFLIYLSQIYNCQNCQNLKRKYEKSINEIEQMVFLANYSQNSSFNEKKVKFKDGKIVN